MNTNILKEVDLNKLNEVKRVGSGFSITFRFSPEQLNGGQGCTKGEVRSIIEVPGAHGYKQDHN